MSKPDTTFNLYRFQKQSFPVLLGWSVGSMVAGLLWWLDGRPTLQGLGSQFLAWGFIDGLIAAFGIRQAQKNDLRYQAGEVLHSEIQDQTRNFERLLGLNSLLDVGYILGGAWLRSTAESGSRRSGIGSGIILQGAFLLVWDLILILVLQDKRRGR